MKHAKPVIDYVVYVIVRIAIAAVQATPMDTCASVARWLAWLFNDKLRFRHKVVQENLSHAFPDWPVQKREQVSREMWEHMFLMICEIAHAPRKIHETNWRNYIRLNNCAPKVLALINRRPAIMLSAHFGNFEVGGFSAGLLGFPTMTVARPLENPHLTELVNSFRSANGQRILPKHGIAQEVADLLEDGENLTLLGDQYAGPKGCWVNFLGRRASYHKAIALFALTANAPVVVVHTRRLENPMEFEIEVLDVFDPAKVEGVIGVREVTQWYNDRLEEMVQRDPKQYWWLHRRWKDRRPKRKKSGPSQPTASQSTTQATDVNATKAA